MYTNLDLYFPLIFSSPSTAIVSNISNIIVVLVQHLIITLVIVSTLLSWEIQMRRLMLTIFCHQLYQMHQTSSSHYYHLLSFFFSSSLFITSFDLIQNTKTHGTEKGSLSYVCLSKFITIIKVDGNRKDLQNSDLMGLGYCLGESHHTGFVPRNMSLLKFLKINGQ